MDCRGVPWSGENGVGLEWRGAVELDEGRVV